MERQLGNLKLDAGNRGEDAPQGSNDDSTKAAAISPPSNAPGMSSSTSSNGQHLALGAINAARRPTQPAVPPNMANMSPEVLARIAGFAGRANRAKGAPNGSVDKSASTNATTPSPSTPAVLPMSSIAGGIAAKRAATAPQLKAGGGLAARRGGLKLSDMAPASSPGSKPTDPHQNNFSKYADVLDTATGSLKFKGAVLSSEGVNFGNGREFKATIDDFEKLEELGRGNYGTVWKVVHKLTKVQMAMKEIRLSLEESVFSSIVMELDVLHKAACPEIVEFFGAFFVEGCVYILMEFMDCGSLEKVYTTNVEEGVLAKITLATVRGLRTLKDQHNIIHRDVKPTNILLNSKGEVKLCDFGVSGNLVASIARTNIGCQSYMAPERIKSENASSGPATYTVHSDIWSLGLSILELAKGGYPYPPETYNNIFAQLQAICDGEPPHLPEEHYSDDARDFVRQCLHKSPTKRPLYAQLLRHPWLVKWASTDVDMTAWVERALEQTRQERAKGTVKQQPALHSFNTQQKV